MKARTIRFGERLNLGCEEIRIKKHETRVVVVVVVFVNKNRRLNSSTVYWEK